MIYAPTRHAAATTALLVTIVTAIAAAQQGPPPPLPPAGPSTAPPLRDDARTALTGTATIAGVINIDDEHGGPLRRAILSLTRSGSADYRMTATDDAGRYLFDSLPPGSYLLSISKGGYVDAAYGATRAGSPGNPIPIVADQHFVAKPVALVHGAAISGTIRNAKGAAVSGVQVYAAALQIVNGERRPRTVAGSLRAQTDAHGNFRIFGLASGDYLVSAASSILQSNVAMREMTPADVQWAEQQTSTTPNASPTPAQSAAAYVYSATFYPGTADPGAATVVSVGKAEDRGGISFQLLHVPTANVSGLVTGLDGQPVANAIVVRALKQLNRFVINADFNSTARTDATGTFRFSNLAPGDYTLTVRSAPATPGRGAPANTPFNLPSGTLTEWGVSDITLNGTDVTDVRVQLQAGMVVSGSAVFEGKVLTPPADLTKVQPGLAPAGPRTTVSVNAQPAGLNADGTFKIDDVMPGMYHMSAFVPGASGSGATRWSLTSATLNGADVLDTDFDVQPGIGVSGITLTFTDQQTELSGRLIDGAGRPAPQFYLLAFSVNKKYWTSGSRWIKSARPGLDGKFTISGLPPGEYYFSALVEFDQQQMFDTAYLEQFIPDATKLVLAEGEKKIQDLRIGG